MAIICGTDFSEASQAACQVAAELAAHHGEPLILVHALVLPPITPPSIPASVYDEVAAAARKSICELAGRLASTGADIRTAVEIGDPDEVLLQCAEKETTRLIVIGSVGRRGARWLLGSIADRLASRSRFPLFVTRPGFPAHEWLKSGEPLRVLVASDLGPSTGPAVAWAAHLPEHGHCQFTVAHLAWPPAEHDRLAIDGPMHIDRTHPLVAELVQRDLAAAARLLRGSGETRVLVESTTGRTADSLAWVASRENADLIVVGRGLEDERQWWEVSTSRAIVRKATMSVVIVPDAAEPEIATPSIRRVLAATDLTRRGNAAVAYALALAPDDGSVRVIHIVEEEIPEERQRRQREIEDLVRSVGTATKASVEIEIIKADDPARRIAAEGERFDADVICIGSQGRHFLAKLFFGSISQEVLLRSDRPVLLVPTI